jgi:hypothetical protein
VERGSRHERGRGAGIRTLVADRRLVGSCVEPVSPLGSEERSADGHAPKGHFPAVNGLRFRRNRPRAGPNARSRGGGWWPPTS